MFGLTGIVSASAGIVHIEVTIDLNANGIMNVSSVDLGTTAQPSVQFLSAMYTMLLIGAAMW